MTLHRGSAGEAVRALQVLLNVRFRAQLRADGLFGPSTEVAVRQAQLCAGRPRTGTVDTADLLAFSRYSPPTPT